MNADLHVLGPSIRLLALVGQEPGCTDFGLLSRRKSERGRRRGCGWRSRGLLDGVGLKQASRLANNGGCGSWLVKGLDGGRRPARC
jgi:hypothetical protein